MFSRCVHSCRLHTHTSQTHAHTASRLMSKWQLQNIPRTHAHPTVFLPRAVLNTLHAHLTHTCTPHTHTHTSHTRTPHGMSPSRSAEHTARTRTHTSLTHTHTSRRPLPPAVLNMDVVVQSRDWIGLDRENLVSVLKRSDLVVRSEYELLRAVVRWLRDETRLPGLHDNLAAVLPYIR